MCDNNNVQTATFKVQSYAFLIDYVASEALNVMKQ